MSDYPYNKSRKKKYDEKLKAADGTLIAERYRSHYSWAPEQPDRSVCPDCKSTTRSFRGHRGDEHGEWVCDNEWHEMDMRKPIYTASIEEIPFLETEAHEICDPLPCTSEEIVAMWNKLRKKYVELQAELAQWKTWCIIEIAVRNPSVAEYMDHWEGRAIKAEAKVERLSAPVSDAEWSEHYPNSVGVREVGLTRSQINKLIAERTANESNNSE